MSYADSLLATGERIIHRERQHWLVLVWGARLPDRGHGARRRPVLARQLGGQASSLRTRSSSRSARCSSSVASPSSSGPTLRYLNQEYVLTNRRVIQVEGVVNKRSTDSSLEKINDAVLTQSIFGRMFGFGDLEVLTASEAGIERFRMIVNPIEFKKAMLDAKHEYEQDMAGSVPGAGSADPRGPGRAARAGRDPRGRRPRATPARPSAVAPAPARRPSAAPAGATPRRPRPRRRPIPTRSPGRSRTSPTCAIEGRSRAEEYESKKADLLGRL